MKELLALTVPGHGSIGAPQGVPTGGIGTGATILQTLITLAFVTAIVVALFMLIYAGMQWIWSQGDKERIASARNRIIFTIIGLVVIFISFALVNMIGILFGINLLNFKF